MKGCFEKTPKFGLFTINSEYVTLNLNSIKSACWIWIFFHLTRYSEEELQQHIQKLHEYNEIKDIGQLLIGKLGNLKWAWFSLWENNVTFYQFKLILQKKKMFLIPPG